MKAKFSGKKAFLLGAAAACAYKFAKGDGIFNKPRYASQHKAVEAYLSNYYTNAEHGRIIRDDNGWHCIVKTPQKSFLLNIHRTEDGMYLFSENEV